VFTGRGINCQHKILPEIDVKLKQLYPKVSIEDYLDIRVVLRNSVARDDFLSLEDDQIWDFILKQLRQYRIQIPLSIPPSTLTFLVPKQAFTGNLQLN
jgi:hypothetical protein